MAPSKTNPKVDSFFTKAKKWQAELRRLRSIILDCALTEELKWYQPCYTWQGKNVIIINGMKEACALAFFKGALLKDARHLLAKPGENTQTGRWIKFTSIQEIAKLEPILKAYIHEAIAVEKSGRKLKLKKVSDFEVPEEFQSKLSALPSLQKAFAALTPGRQKSNLLYFSSAKQSSTRAARVEKCIPQILKGIGLND